MTDPNLEDKQVCPECKGKKIVPRKGTTMGCTDICSACGGKGTLAAYIEGLKRQIEQLRLDWSDIDHLKKEYTVYREKSQQQIEELQRQLKLADDAGMKSVQVIALLTAEIERLKTGIPQVKMTVKNTVFGEMLEEMDKYEQKIADQQILIEQLADNLLLQSKVGQWANDIFGKSQTVIGVLNHLIKEVKELCEAKEPSDAKSEAADCLLLLMQHAHELGYDLFEEAKKKHQINLKRKWGKPNEYGVIEHIKDNATLAAVTQAKEKK